LRARLPHDIADLARTIASIAASRPDSPVNMLLLDAFLALYAEALRAGAPAVDDVEDWSAEKRPSYADLLPVVEDLARQPALAPHRPSGRARTATLD
jgi:hypothetical protein